MTSDQKLDIGPQLTVIYGPNGSGKSGYARILKASCFTRSKHLNILGNINIAASERPPISATFELGDGVVTHLSPGVPSKILRDNFAVFDSSCIRVHTDEKKAFVVTPYLFDVFPRMVAVIADVNEKLKAFKKSKEVDVTVLRIPEGKSEVARLLDGLSAKTDRDRLTVLGTLLPDEIVRSNQLEVEIDQLKKSDPADIIKKKSNALQDLLLLDEKLRTGIANLSVQATGAIATALLELKTLREQAALVSASSFEQEPLQPVGTPAWKELLNAALAFNTEVYSSQEYPADTEDVRCVLCQQSLQQDAKERLRRFYVFMKSDIEQKIKDAKKKLAILAQTIKGVDLALFAYDSALRRTADELQAGLSQEVDKLLVILNERKDAILNAVKAETSFAINDSTTSVFKQIKGLTTTLTEEITALKTKDPAQLIKRFQDELMLLNERKILASRLAQVLAALDNLIVSAQAAKVGPVSAKSVTDRQKSLMTKLVGTGFRDHFRRNCEQLGLNLPLDFKIRGSDGEAHRQLEFGATGGAEAQLSHILSEGELTVVALADFLTEIALNDLPVGLVFDDPVSSMDHLNKECIAKRLVQEAQARQVIIFTHDILFSHHLATEVEKIGTGFSFVGHTVIRNHHGDVGCIDNLLFPHSHYEGQAAKRADEFLEKAKTTTESVQRDYLEKGCGCLRTAYEDFIQAKLFANVVRRWREKITFNLKDVYFPDQIGEQVDERMGMLSRFIDAHSHSDVFHDTPLTVDFLESELQLYRTLTSNYSKDKKVWGKSKVKAEFS